MVAEFYNQRWISAKCKRHITGDLDKHKGRLVALGNIEAPDLDRELFQSHYQQQDHQPHVCARSATWSQDAWT